MQLAVPLGDNLKTVVLVPGTFANADRNAPQDLWWRPDSHFCRAAAEHGLLCLSFAWGTQLDGVLGENADWKRAAEILYAQTKDLQPVTIIAHSHGGNVVIYACAEFGLRVRKLDAQYSGPARRAIRKGPVADRPLVAHIRRAAGLGTVSRAAIRRARVVAQGNVARGRQHVPAGV